MKKTQFIELLSLIKHTIVPFLSIVLFVMMSITLFAGLTWTGESLEDRIDEALDEGNAYDYLIYSELGITDSDLVEIEKLDGVSAVEPAYISYQTIRSQDENNQDSLYCCVYSITSTINTLNVVEGTLPTKSDEIALLQTSAQNCGYKVGDTVTFEADGDDPSVNNGMKFLKSGTFTVTAIVGSSDYLCTTPASLGINQDGKQISCVFYTAKDTFSADTYMNSYPVVYVAANGLNAFNSFSTEYSQASSSILSEIQQVGSVLAVNRYNTVKDQADSKISEVQSQLDSAKSKIDSAEAQLADGEQLLNEKKAELADAKSKVAYYTEMSASLKTLSETVSENFETLVTNILSHAADPDYHDQVIALCNETNAANTKEIANFKQTYPTYPSELDTLFNKVIIDTSSYESIEEFEENAPELRAEVSKTKTELMQSSQEQLAAANSQIAEGEAQLASGEAQLEDGKDQIAKAKSQYAQGEQKFSEYKEKAQQIKPASWSINNRSDSHVCKIAGTTAQTLDSLRLTMALLFLIIGLLVCYSVIARLVHEQTAQLGTKKALGFTLFEISKLFLGYTLLACAIGIILGALIGAPIVQFVLLPRVNQYVFSTPSIVFNWIDILPVILVQVVLMCLFAWFACRSILKKSAIELLAGQKPSLAKQRFYEKWACWKRMGLLTQTMVNNCFNDKRRVFGTLVGVAGCTALIVCAITLQAGIKETTDCQENVIEKYDQVVYVTGNANSESTAESSSKQTVDDVIASNNLASARVQYSVKSIALPDGLRAYITVIVPENMDDLSNVMTVEMSQGDSSLNEDGIYISSALARYYSYEPGEGISFNSSDGTERTTTISGVFDYYGGSHIAIMDKQTYKECFGTDANFTARLIAFDDNASELLSQIKAADDYDGIFDSQKITHVISSTVNNLALTVVAIYIGISALVALFVLLNLNIMYIAEKKRELIVMMVNGYDVKDAKRYVSRDTIIMNTLGMIIGCMLGTTMGMLAIQSLQNDRLSFIANVSPFACLVGIVVCAIFSFIVMRIALRKVDKFSLTSVND